MLFSMYFRDLIQTKYLITFKIGGFYICLRMICLKVKVQPYKVHALQTGKQQFLQRLRLRICTV